MIDTILYVPDMPALVAEIDANHPEMLERDDEGDLTNPPVVTGFARTPAHIGPDGNSLMVYARLREEEVQAWRDMPHVEVLAEAPFEGKGTADTVYQQVQDDPDKLTKYKSVYNTDSYEFEDEDGETTTVTPPFIFGIIAGA